MAEDALSTSKEEKKLGCLGKVSLFGREFEVGFGAGLGLGAGIDGPGGTGLKCGVGWDPFQRAVGIGCGVRVGVILGIDIGFGIGVPLFTYSKESEPDWRALGGAAADFVVSKLTGGERLFTIGSSGYVPATRTGSPARFVAGPEGIAATPVLPVVPTVVHAGVCNALRPHSAADGPVGSSSGSMQ